MVVMIGEVDQKKEGFSSAMDLQACDTKLRN